MSDLPEAESAFDVVDVNARTARRQYLKWMLMAGALASVGGVFIWRELASPSAEAAAKDDPARIVATMDTASGGRMTPEATAAEANERARALEQELLRAREDNVALKAETESLRTSQASDRADAMTTIEALEKAAVRADAPPPGPAVAAATPSAAPGFGANPFAPVAAGEREVEARPRRTMAVIRTPAAAKGVPLASGDAPAEGSSGGAAAGGKAGAAGQPGFMSGALQTFETGRFVPPNAYVKARVLVGVDAAAAVNVSSDPKPVLFRLLGPAIGVGTSGKFQTTDLTGCTVNGAAYGELSSEKVYIKLQRISCPAGERRFSVATVEGYVSHAGKAGVRGRVISREGDLTNRALIAGALQGLGDVFSANAGRSTGTVNLTGEGGLFGSEKLSGGEIAKGAVGGGVSGAASMLADYYIKRAEQYQPVIEMPTGVDVELVFLSGFQIEGAN